MRIGDDPDAHAATPTPHFFVDAKRASSERSEREKADGAYQRKAASRVKFSTTGAAPLAAEEVHISPSAPTICSRNLDFLPFSFDSPLDRLGSPQLCWRDQTLCFILFFSFSSPRARVFDSMDEI